MPAKVVVPVSSRRRKVTKTDAVVEKAHKVSKPHRFHPGTVADREIRRAQKSDALLFRKGPFLHFVKHVSEQYKDGGLRISGSVTAPLQQYVEDSLAQVLSYAYKITTAKRGKNGRKTLLAEDVKLAREAFRV